VGQALGLTWPLDLMLVGLAWPLDLRAYKK
jgi:hypothetical protein